jgi:hypothetical protein
MISSVAGVIVVVTNSVLLFRSLRNTPLTSDIKSATPMPVNMNIMMKREDFLISGRLSRSGANIQINRI